jgi:DNA-binding protein H-NS
MKSYKELQVEIQELQARAEKLREAEMQKAVEEIRQKMAEYGLSVQDLGGVARRGRKSGSTGVVKPKYRNPETGDTWTGRGKPPRWIAGKDKEQYLIK